MCHIFAFQTMLHEVTKFRELKAKIYAPPETKANKYEYVPWTAASGAGGIRDTLLHIISIAWKYGVRSTGEPDLRQRHYKNLVELVDFVLDGRRAYLESIRGTEKYNGLLQKYETHRSELIYNFGEWAHSPELNQPLSSTEMHCFFFLIFYSRRWPI